MKLLVLILAIVPIYASSDVFGDLLGQEFYHVTFEHLREKRQAHGQAQVNYRPLSQAPAQIKQLLQSQLARDPIVHLPPQPPPRLGSPQGQPQYQTQAQVSQYRPQVQHAGAPQQPTYKSIPVPSAQYRQPTAPRQPQYRPAAGNYPQQAPQQNYAGAYRPIAAPQAPPQRQYSSKLPPQLQQLLQIQANLPNSIPQGHAAPQPNRY